MRFDRTEVAVFTFRPRVPVFHAIPDWHAGEGWKGEPALCNRYVHRGTDVTIGNNDGVTLPEEVVAPCGARLFYRLADPIDTRLPAERLDGARMHFVHSCGARIPRGHAEKIGRPCQHCYPEARTP